MSFLCEIENGYSSIPFRKNTLNRHNSSERYDVLSEELSICEVEMVIVVHLFFMKILSLGLNVTVIVVASIIYNFPFVNIFCLGNFFVAEKI